MTIEVTINKDNICTFINNEHIGVELMEEAWQFCEDNKNNEDIYYPIMEKLMDLNDTYLETWNRWIIPELDDRRQEGKPVSFELVLCLLHNWGPGPRKYTIVDEIESRYMEAMGYKSFTEIPDEELEFIDTEYGPGPRKYTIVDEIESRYMEAMGYKSFTEIPDEELEFIDTEYGLPKEWNTMIQMKHFRDELIEFTDTAYLQDTLANYWSEISDIPDLQEILINLASENDGLKARNNLDLFLQIIEDCAPYENPFSSNKKAWITEIINEGYWDEDEIETIQEKFYNIDFEVPYRMIEDQRIADEVAHIKKMTDLNPLYRHD
jgi:hypothetical protein